jgi:hypothetical protein
VRVNLVRIPKYTATQSLNLMALDQTGRRRSFSTDPGWRRGREASDFKGHRGSTASVTTTIRTGRANSTARNGPPHRQSNPDILQVAEVSEGESTNSQKAAKGITPITTTEKGTVSNVSWWDKLIGFRKKRNEHNDV